jgi:hypothetical protein
MFAAPWACQKGLDVTDAAYCAKYRATYETFDANCPYCDHLNIYNRASDLADLRAVGFKEVSCQSCARVFIINGDLVNPPHELLLYDCADLIARKRYAYAVLNAAQSFEVFFSLFLRVELGYKPFAREATRPPIGTLNATLNELFGTVKCYTYVPLRDVFLRLMLTNTRPSSMADAAATIKSLPKLCKHLTDLEIVSGYPPGPVRDLLVLLNQSTVHDARNAVVHKDAYRPTLEEATRAVEEAKDILFPLGVHLLLLTDDFNWHVKHA